MMKHDSTVSIVGRIRHQAIFGLLNVCIILTSNCYAFLFPTYSDLSTGLLQSLKSIEYGSGDKKPNACIVGYISPNLEEELSHVLRSAGYENVVKESDLGLAAITPVFKYKYIKASGMLKLIEESNISSDQYSAAPKYIPVQSGEENVLVANGWSFLDPDESEPLSAFDIDAANAEGQYKPKWGIDENNSQSMKLHLSSLGYDLTPMNSDEILSEAESIHPLSRQVLLDGGTDEANLKMTNNECDFSGSVSNFDEGLFTCAIGGNPLFTTNDLSPLTASSGWLSFFRPVSKDHISLVKPDKDSMDQRIEVVDAKTGCHLGHYFGQDGYCINARALNFFSSSDSQTNDWKSSSNPVSWHPLHSRELSISQQLLKQVSRRNVKCKTVLLGAGCFWHVEFALRRLPGVVKTEVGYAGGSFASPNYEDVCKKQTNHAEVVKVTFDPKVCDPRRLIDCFLAIHDPTVIRAHGKRAQSTGQYRSCIFTFDPDMEQISLEALTDCRVQLAKVLSTEVKSLSLDSFWVAEDRHQRHDERVKKKSGDDVKTLSESEWLLEYGRRSSSIFGSAETMQVMLDDSDDDGMARMMI